MTIFDDRAQIWSRDRSFWKKLNVDYEIINWIRKRYPRDHLATRIVFSNEVIVTESHQNPLNRQGTILVVFNNVIRIINKILKVSSNDYE